MNTGNLIHASWFVNDSGYELVRRGGEPRIRERASGPHSPVNLEADWLFSQFSEITTSEQSMDFASRYGLLGLPVSSVSPVSFTHLPATLEYFGPRHRRRRHSEAVADWLGEALVVRQVLSLWEEVLQANAKGADRHANEAERINRLLTGGFLLLNVQDMTRGGASFHLPPPLADAELDGLDDLPDPLDNSRQTLIRAVTTRLGHLPTAPVLVPTEGPGVAALAFRPLTLLAVIWMQLAQAIANIETLRRCEYCRRVILVGWTSDPTSHGNRTNRRVCSDSCRTQLSRRRRKQLAVKKQ